MHLKKYHALGNDYLVVTAEEIGRRLTPENVQSICDRHTGIGSDGILVRKPPTADDKYGLRIFNPDGSEAEKSGNGLRIFARYLWDQGVVADQPFGVATAGGAVVCQVIDAGQAVVVQMGKVSFQSSDIPVTGPDREVLQETIVIDKTSLVISAATIGNPHCVVIREQLSAEETNRWGPRLETAPLFPNRTNVQFLKVIGRDTIQLEIWERGAGYTLASGSSSSAAAAVAHRLGLVDSSVNVVMPGGTIGIKIGADYDITMTGAVTRVADIELSDDIFSEP